MFEQLAPRLPAARRQRSGDQAPVQRGVVDRGLGALDRIALGFAWAVDAKSPFTYRHSERVAEIAVGIGDRLGLPAEARARLRRAGWLHDVGKLSVPNRILDKPGPLTADEWKVVRLHPVYTYEILDRVPLFAGFAFDASSHHERLDGTGYYRGLGGDQLSPAAQILAVADNVDALAADRPYRAGLAPERVAAILQEARGTGLCPACVDAALDLLAQPAAPAPRG